MAKRVLYIKGCERDGYFVSHLSRIMSNEKDFILFIGMKGVKITATDMSYLCMQKLVSEVQALFSPVEVIWEE
jgi:hypothetical protein